MLNQFKIFIAAITCSLTFAASVHASPILQIDDTGILTGATGVMVNDVLYDVQFKDGECGSIASLCDHPSSFTFSTSDSAQAASQALLDQVFLGVYDENYKLTNGCQQMLALRTGCAVLTAYSNRLTSGPHPLLVVLAEAAFNTDFNEIQSWSLLGDDSTRTIWDYATYAVWTQATVPEPSPLALLLAGLLAVLLTKKCRLAATRQG